MIDKAYKKVVELYENGCPYIQKNEIDSGDRYYSEDGIEYIVTLPDTVLNIGYMYIIEDDDNWAQADSYEVKWNRINDKNITDNDMFEILNNIDQIIREQKLNKII